VKDYDLKYDGKTLHIEKGISIMIPVHCFHHDPQFFPEPQKFDPDRFNEENRKNIDPDTYMPFGIGPRNCIGSRFALMELKTIFYCLLLNFTFEKTERTLIPFEYEDAPFAMKPKDGTWVALKPRD
jgi:cytochrome P450 family 9